MDVSIILVNYNTKDLTRNCLNSIYEKTQGVDFEIFVVDNNSHDGSADMVEQEFPKVNLIRNTDNKGFGSANNIAIRQANGKYIFCLNTDTLLINNAIKIMFDFMEKKENQNVGVCGGYIVDIENNPMICGGNLPSLLEVIFKFGFKYIFKNFYLRNLNVNILSNQANTAIEYITGADAFFRKSILDEVGIFDEKIFMYFEDSDLCKRISDFGYNIRFIKEAKIIHLEGQSATNLLQKKKQFKKSQFYYFKKHYPIQLNIIKFLYIILYLIDEVLNKKNNKELLSFIIKECK